MKPFAAEISVDIQPRNLEVVEATAPEISTRDSFLIDVFEGLSRPQKSIPAKYFYDRRGSDLFESICRQPEYYLTRTELALLRRHAHDIAELAGPNAHLIEFGSGASVKVRLLLDALRAPASYAAVDISRAYLVDMAQALAFDYPRVRVFAICVDFSRPFSRPKFAGPGARVGFFPGSTIGNFTPLEAREFLEQAATILKPGGSLIVGVDLKKDIACLTGAYNDRAGVTAAFNLNLLERINRELRGTFDLDAYAHHAFYNEAEGRIEMHLRSLKSQQVAIAGCEFALAMHETIHTENSYKYTIEEFQALAASAGFMPLHHWVDADRLFSIHYLTMRR